MHRTYGDRADFLTVYIKEAHPEDEWQMEPNPTEGVCYRQPRSLAERVAIANDFVRRFGWDVPMAVDPIENPADLAYAGWPERFYVLDERGVIVFKGEPGPFGFKPEEVERWLAARPAGRRLSLLRSTIAVGADENLPGEFGVDLVP